MPIARVDIHPNDAPAVILLTGSRTWRTANLLATNLFGKWSNADQPVTLCGPDTRAVAVRLLPNWIEVLVANSTGSRAGVWRLPAEWPDDRRAFIPIRPDAVYVERDRWRESARWIRWVAGTGHQPERLVAAFASGFPTARP
jgi:hypothetical protein